MRHGESTWNSEGRFQGGLDAPLSARGRAQATALATGLAATPFDGLYTSPLSRARETAAAWARLGLEPVALDELREIGLGNWEGLTLETVRRGRGALPALARGAGGPSGPGRRADARLASRVRAALERLGSAHPEGRVLVVSHGGAISSALCGWLGRPLNAIWSFRLDNASITRVELPAGRLLGVNETGHLADVARERSRHDLAVLIVLLGGDGAPPLRDAAHRRRASAARGRPPAPGADPPDGEPFTALLTGAAATALIQSSTATTIMVIGFVQAGLLTLYQAMGIILGADIGTTFTVQLLAFHIYDYALLFVGIGFAMTFLGKCRILKDLGHATLGFGLIFLGLKLMIEGMEPLKDSAIVGQALLAFA